MAFGAHNATRGFTRHRQPRERGDSPTPPGSPTNRYPAGMELTRSITSVAISSIDRLKWGFDPIHSALHRFAELARDFAKRDDLIDNYFSRFFSQPAGVCRRVDFATALSVWTEQVFGQAGLTSPAIRGVSTPPGHVIAEMSISDIYSAIL